MSPLDLIRGADGKMVLTKLQAATFHFLLAIAVATITTVRVYRYVQSGEPPSGNEFLFDATMWGLYATVAVGHAVLDKTGVQVAAFKNRQLDAEANPVDKLVTKTEMTSTKTESPN